MSWCHIHHMTSKYDKWKNNFGKPPTPMRIACNLIRNFKFDQKFSPIVPPPNLGGGQVCRHVQQKHSALVEWPSKHAQKRRPPSAQVEILKIHTSKVLILPPPSITLFLSCIGPMAFVLSVLYCILLLQWLIWRNCPNILKLGSPDTNPIQP